MIIQKKNLSIVCVMLLLFTTLICGCISPDDGEDETVPEETEAPDNAVFFVPSSTPPQTPDGCYGADNPTGDATGTII